MLFTNWTYLPSLIIALTLAITVHEFAHAWMGWRLGDPTAKYAGRLTLNPLAHLDPLGTLLLLLAGFGWGKPVPYNPHNLKHPRRDSLLIALAGPISNFLLALFFSIIFKHFYLGEEGSWFFILFYFLIYVNLVLMVFNLLPIPPLDGSQILTSLWKRPSAALERWLAAGPQILFTILILEHFLPSFHPLSSILDFLINHIALLIGYLS